MLLTGKDICLPDIFSVKKHHQGQLDHVPVAAAIVVHQVERQRHMRVTVVKAQVVLWTETEYRQAVMQKLMRAPGMLADIVDRSSRGCAP